MDPLHDLSKSTEMLIHRSFTLSRFVAALLFFLSLLNGQLNAADSQKSERIRIGYSSISGSRIGLWVAQDKGFFSRNGLQTEMVVLSGILGIQSLIAGEIQFYLGATDSAAQAASKGSDLFLFASAEPLRYKLIAHPPSKPSRSSEVRKLSSIVSAARVITFRCVYWIRSALNLKTWILFRWAAVGINGLPLSKPA